MIVLLRVEGAASDPGDSLLGGFIRVNGVIRSFDQSSELQSFYRREVLRFTPLVVIVFVAVAEVDGVIHLVRILIFPNGDFH